MTFSICVREAYEDDDGAAQTRFGVGVTTRVPCVGHRVPWASAAGAIATQSVANVELGRRGLRYVEDGLAIGDALRAMLAADPGADQRQVHGVDADGVFAHSGEACADWYGHETDADLSLGGSTPAAYTVAGNHLTGPAVVEATARAYADGDPTEPLGSRLVDALAAGAAEGGDSRVEELPVQSAAVAVETTETYAKVPAHHNVRVDATETPMEDLRATYDLAASGFEQFLAHIAAD